MDLSTLYTKWKQFIGRMNAYGVPIPTIRDPKTGTGSVSLSLVFISSVLVIVGLVGKWSGKLGVIDINNSLEFFYASSALYFGRNWGVKGSSKSLGVGDAIAEPPVKPVAAPKADNPDA